MSGALVFIDYTSKGSRWVSSNDPLPVTGGGTVSAPSVVVGNIASGETDSGAPVKVAAVCNTPTLPTVTTGERVDLQADARGNLRAKMVGVNTNGARGASNSMVFVQSETTNVVGETGRLLAVGPSQFNGSTWDPNVKPNVSKRIASSAASGNPDFLKGSAGELTKFWGLNGAAITYVQIYNKATAPTIGTDTPIFTYPVAANALFDVTIPNGGYYFATGIAYAFTTDAAGTTGAAAAAVTSCNILGA
jgi:hypothetical protein